MQKKVDSQELLSKYRVTHEIGKGTRNENECCGAACAVSGFRAKTHGRTAARKKPDKQYSCECVENRLRSDYEDTGEPPKEEPDNNEVSNRKTVHRESISFSERVVL